MIIEFNFDSTASGPESDDFFKKLVAVEHSADGKLSDIKINHNVLEEHLRDKKSNFVKTLKTHPMCLRTRLITNNQSVKIQGKSLEELRQHFKDLQPLLKTPILNPSKLPAEASKFVSMAMSTASDDDEENDATPKEDAFQKTVNTALDNIVNLVDKQYFFNMRDINMRDYKALQVEGLKKIDKDAKF